MPLPNRDSIPENADSFVSGAGSLPDCDAADRAFETKRQERLDRYMSCLWSEDEEGNWETDCGELHVFFEGTPGENKYKFCPYCGTPLTAVLWTEPIDDEEYTDCPI